MRQPPPKQADWHADARLMAASARGSSEAFGTLIRKWQGELLNFFRRLGADVHEAEDAVQETFLRVFRYRERYRPEAPFRVFLFRLGRNAWIDLKRKTTRWYRGETQAVDVDSQPALPGVRPEDRMDLEAGLASLPERHRMVLVLSVYQGLRYEEVSQIMDVPVGTVKSRVFHALRKLRERLACDAQTG